MKKMAAYIFVRYYLFSSPTIFGAWGIVCFSLPSGFGGSEVKRVRRGKAILPIQDVRLESCSCTYTSYSLQKKESRRWKRQNEGGKKRRCPWVSASLSSEDFSLGGFQSLLQGALWFQRSTTCTKKAMWWASDLALLQRAAQLLPRLHVTFYVYKCFADSQVFETMGLDNLKGSIFLTWLSTGISPRT